MKSIVAGVFCFFVFGFSYEEVNKVVGKVIDRNEASYYRIFEDVPGFCSARFFIVGDSICVEMNVSNNGVHESSYRTISMMSFIALGKYTEHFRSVIEDPAFRRDFAANYTIDWPLVTEENADKMKRQLITRAVVNTACCAANGTAISANCGANRGLKVDHYYETEVYNYCTDKYGTIHVPVYTVNQSTYYGAIAAGFTLSFSGALLFNSSIKKKLPMELLNKDILAFDKYGIPITDSEIKKLMRSRNQCCFSSLGLVLGGLTACTSALILCVMNLPKDYCYDWKSKEDLERITYPILALSIVEFVTIIKVFNDWGAKKDREAAIKLIIHGRKVQKKSNKTTDNPGVNK